MNELHDRIRASASKIHYVRQELILNQCLAVYETLAVLVEQTEGRERRRAPLSEYEHSDNWILRAMEMPERGLVEKRMEHIPQRLLERKAGLRARVRVNDRPPLIRPKPPQHVAIVSLANDIWCPFRCFGLVTGSNQTPIWGYFRGQNKARPDWGLVTVRALSQTRAHNTQ